MSLFKCDSIRLLTLKIDSSIEWPVIEHLSAQGRLDPRGRLHCFWCPHKTWIPPLGASNTQTIVENGSEMRKLWPPKVKGVKNSKKQTIEHHKASSQTPKRFLALWLLCCFDAIRVQRWFVEIWVALLLHFKLFKMNKK